MVYLEGKRAQTGESQFAELPRPPGAPPGDAFFEACFCCGDCGSVCPKQAIRLVSIGYPFLLTTATCVNCGLCVNVCMHGAIDFTALKRVGMRYTKLLEMVGRDG